MVQNEDHKGTCAQGQAGKHSDHIKERSGGGGGGGGGAEQKKERKKNKQTNKKNRKKTEMKKQDVTWSTLQSLSQKRPLFLPE